MTKTKLNAKNRLDKVYTVKLQEYTNKIFEMKEGFFKDRSVNPDRLTRFY